MEEVRRAAASLRNHSRRAISWQTKEVQMAVVRQIDPIAVEVTESHLYLDDDDLTLSQDVRVYERQYGLKVGDTVTVTPIGRGDYVVSDVVSDKYQFEGADTNPVLGAGTIGGTGPGTAIIGTVSFYDKDGNVIGRLPLLAP